MLDEQPNNKKYLRNIVIFLLIIGGYTLFTKVFKADTTEQLWNSTWTTSSFEDPSIKIDLPVKLDEVSSSDDESNTRTYGFESRHISISLSTLKFQDDLEITLEELASQHFEKFSSLMNFQKLEVRQAMHENPGVNVLAGSMTLDNQKYEISHFSIQKGTTYGTLIIYYQEGDEYGTKIKDRILSSVKM
ncbi:MAG TPA: hypothetical protein VK589_02055 [Chryseolinea sp.]|nr:hypothetical protein [Chryseolinea sp.]